MCLCWQFCGLKPVTCRRLACGNFTVLGNSTGAHNAATLNSGQNALLLYKENLTITCADNFLLSTSNAEKCDFSFTVSCNDHGEFVSKEPLDTVRCVPAKKLVKCPKCRKSWGVGADLGEPNFPAGFAALDCTVGHCDPPHGNPSFEVPRSGTDRCEVQTDPVHDNCLPVQCRPLLLPVSAARLEVAGVSYLPKTGGIYPTSHCGDVVKVFCAPEHAPEEVVKAGIDCNQTDHFNMTCDERGFWTGHQKCVPKACVISELHISNVLKIGESYDKPCVRGSELVPRALVEVGMIANTSLWNVSIMVPPPKPVCQSNCLLDVEDVCAAWSCKNYTVGEYVNSSVPINTTTYGKEIEVTCSTGYAFFTPGLAGCSQTFHPVCQLDKTFNRQDGQQCFPVECPPYETIAQNIKVTGQTAKTTRYGDTIHAECKEEFADGFGYGFNISSLPASMVAVRGRATAKISTISCADACTWSEAHNCIPVPCKCWTFGEFAGMLPHPTDGSVHPILHSNYSDGLMDPGEIKTLTCPNGYIAEGSDTSLTCAPECLLNMPPLRCVQPQCSWSTAGFLTKHGVKSAPDATARMLVGDKVTVECQNGFGLSMSEYEPPPIKFTLAPIKGLEALGDVKVFAAKSFPPPDRTKDVSVSLDGEFAEVKLDLPAGAWPEGLTEGPSMTVFEMPPSNDSATDKKKIAGKAINFGPEGIKFSKPVTLSLPLDLSGLDLGGLQLRPHRYNPEDGSWTMIPFPDGYEPPAIGGVCNASNSSSSSSSNASNASACSGAAAPSIIKGATMSFSAYAALGVPPEAPAGVIGGTGTIEEPEEEEAAGGWIPILIGVIVGYAQPLESQTRENALR